MRRRTPSTRPRCGWSGTDRPGRRRQRRPRRLDDARCRTGAWHGRWSASRRCSWSARRREWSRRSSSSLSTDRRCVASSWTPRTCCPASTTLPTSSSTSSRRRDSASCLPNLCVDVRAATALQLKRPDIDRCPVRVPIHGTWPPQTPLPPPALRGQEGALDWRSWMTWTSVYQRTGRRTTSSHGWRSGRAMPRRRRRRRSAAVRTRTDRERPATPEHRLQAKAPSPTRPRVETSTCRSIYSCSSRRNHSREWLQSRLETAWNLSSPTRWRDSKLEIHTVALTDHDALDDDNKLLHTEPKYYFRKPLLKIAFSCVLIFSLTRQRHRVFVFR